MKLRLTRRALGDIDRIADYLSIRNPPASWKVRDSIEAGFDLIVSYPQAGRIQRFGVRRLTLPRVPYLVFYKIDQPRDEIIVLTIRHGARKPLA